MFDCDEMSTSETDESLSASPTYDRYKSEDGYHAVPPPYTGTFMPPKPDLVFHDPPNVHKTVHTAFNVELSPTKLDKDFVLSPEFKLLNENQVLLRVPRENNMYNVDLKNIVPSGDLTCLFAKNPNCTRDLAYKLLENKPNVVGEKPELEGRKPESEVYVFPSSNAQTKKHDDKTKREAKGKIPVVGQILTNSTNTFIVAGPSNTVVSPTHGKSSYVNTSQYPDDPNMPELEDITYSDDEEDVGAEADFTNLETSITVSPIPTTIVHKDHPVTQIISNLSSATQTRTILPGTDNHPPMLEKDMYDSWKSRIELYMLNRQHGRMILESVEQGLPPEVYALVSTHKVAKELWEMIQMLMQGTSLTKQEKECKLYDAFDKFAYQKGETLCDFYLRFSLLLNDMNMYNSDFHCS
nr:ribonuclease H-like domain-containing protein [Tanacetum cinerariifolium]